VDCPYHTTLMAIIRYGLVESGGLHRPCSTPRVTNLRQTAFKAAELLWDSTMQFTLTPNAP
jgi:hypothetical protein